MATKPRRTLEDALRRARVANRLAAKSRAALERRLEAGLLEQFQTDRAFLGDPEARDAAALRKQTMSTAVERETAARGYRFVLRVRELVERHKGVSDELRVAVGVGDKLSRTETGGVALALASIIGRATDLAALGVLPEDVDLDDYPMGALLAMTVTGDQTATQASLSATLSVDIILKNA